MTLFKTQNQLEKYLKFTLENMEHFHGNGNEDGQREPNGNEFYSDFKTLNSKAYVERLQ